MLCKQCIAGYVSPWDRILRYSHCKKNCNLYGSYFERQHKIQEMINKKKTSVDSSNI